MKIEEVFLVGEVVGIYVFLFHNIYSKPYKIIFF